MLATTNGVHLRQPSPHMNTYFLTLPNLNILHYLGMDQETVIHTRNRTGEPRGRWLGTPGFSGPVAGVHHSLLVHPEVVEEVEGRESYEVRVRAW